MIPLPEEYREREQAARSEMLETLADFDDDLMEMLLEEQEPPAEDIMRHLRKTLGADQVVPVFMGVAERDMGVRRLLEALARGGAGAGRGRGAGRASIRAGPRWSRCSRTTTCRMPASCRWRGSGRGAVKDGMTLGGMRVGGVYRMFGGQHDNVGARRRRRDRRPRPARGGAGPGRR